MPLRGSDFRLKSEFGRKICRDLPMCGDILFASTEVVPDLLSTLLYDLIWKIKESKKEMLGLGVCITQICSSAGLPRQITITLLLTQIEGIFAQIPSGLSSRGFGRNRTGDPADKQNLSSPALFSTELWPRMRHRRSFRTLLTSVTTNSIKCLANLILLRVCSKNV